MLTIADISVISYVLTILDISTILGNLGISRLSDQSNISHNIRIMNICNISYDKKNTFSQWFIITSPQICDGMIVPLLALKYRVLSILSIFRYCYTFELHLVIVISYCVLPGFLGFGVHHPRMRRFSKINDI